jgi:hypothetical protein
LNENLIAAKGFLGEVEEEEEVETRRSDSN